MRTLPAIALLLTAAQLGACQSAKPSEEAPKVAGLEMLPNLPLPPDGSVLTSQSSADAMQVIAVSPQRVDSVVAYYRDFLAKEPFRLINESTADSTTSFYVEQEGPSLWITVQRNGDSGSMVVIAGAATDTSAVARAKALERLRNAQPSGGKKPVASP
jgi:hypothetical protein